MILRSIDATLEGAAILNEWDGDVSLRMWQTLRDIRLWAEIVPARRLGLFRDVVASLRAPSDPALHPTLRSGLEMISLQLAEPSSADPICISAACRQVSHHTECNDMPETAVSFAACAALVSPHRAADAYETGRLMTTRGDRVRSETWLRRSVALARQSGERAAYSSALVLLGDLYAGEGETARAELEEHTPSPALERALVDLALAGASVGSVERARAAVSRLSHAPRSGDAVLALDKIVWCGGSGLVPARGTEPARNTVQRKGSMADPSSAGRRCRRYCQVRDPGPSPPDGTECWDEEARSRGAVGREPGAAKRSRLRSGAYRILGPTPVALLVIDKKFITAGAAATNRPFAERWLWLYGAQHRPAAPTVPCAPSTPFHAPPHRDGRTYSCRRVRRPW